jgi:hypothetical protein
VLCSIDDGYQQIGFFYQARDTASSKHVVAFSRRISPEFRSYMPLSIQRAQRMPGARRTRSRAW